ncbi:DUF481 domain-containing protein [Pseudotamlana agarivorans]|uniref:DUF481 domain-containing protein n=1 Tax=Pseudotamlana agarivorans TaxID=481183 RepID=UPI00083320E4|nr:DUF481 domain-containing protein [Tamlana agarivorans]
MENFIIEKDTVGFSGGIELNGSLIKNTKNIFTLHSYSYVEYKKEKNTLALITSINRKITDSEDDVNNTTIQLRYDYRYKENLFWESFVQSFVDKVANIDHRMVLGSGTRFQHTKNKKFMYSFGTYLMFVYEHEDDNIEDDEVDNLPTIYRYEVRFNGYASFVYDINENISVKLAGYYQPRVDFIKDHRIDGMGRLSIKVLENLDFNLTYVINLDPYPAKNIPTTQYQLVNGLSYTFK